MLKNIFIIVILFTITSCNKRSKEINIDYIDQYNVVWDSQSKNSSESMPLGGGDIGCNVWVENGDILFYISRSGTFDENNTMLKLGRSRIRLNPNPFTWANYTFKQELNLREGCYAPIDGHSFVWEINGVDVNIFEAYLKELSKHRPNEYKIVVIDNAGFHSSKNIEVPENIHLLNIPPYTPELNPCEQVW